MPIAKYAQQNLTPKRRSRRSRGFGGGLWKPKPGQSFSDNSPETAKPNPRIEPELQSQS